MGDEQELRVLIVEDEAILAMELELILTDMGHHVVGSAMDTTRSLEIAAREHPDLALVDINLRDGATGPEIARRLVRDHGVAAIFITANPEQIPVGFSGALGAMPKPFDETGIRDIVEFARKFIRERELGQPPKRFRMAPWLLTPPDDIKRH
ncbi:MAG TPA: response regulator [Caulobacteraceae bacterium]|nr:response regulator [Caulobacteraceae bacterium]